VHSQTRKSIGRLAVSDFNDTFLKACRQEPTDYIPVWFMRQAGRSLPGYRKLRKKYGVIELAQTPELAAQVSMEPVHLLGVDAAILFADIMLLPMAMGVDVKLVDNVGPIVTEPINSMAAIETLNSFDPKNIDYLSKTIRILRKELEVPVIGFSAAPFTLASYLIEGEPSRKWLKTKRLMFEQKLVWDKFMNILSDAIIMYLLEQVKAGAQALQIFDSWVGCLSASDYRSYVLPHVQKIFTALKGSGVPRIYFGTDTAAMLKDFSDVDCEVIGLDWRIDIGEAKRLIGDKAFQGNLDPAVLLSDLGTIKKEAGRIIDSLPSRQGFIFNLGHGVLPQTNDQTLKKLVEFVHEY
jgi:uroporphyrinogen decarboxylase